MNILYSWLKDIVGCDVPADELAASLTAAGLEVSSVTRFSVPDNIRVARILAVNRHPQADRLTVCAVDTGASSPRTIVCGALNTRAGMLAPLAMEGALLGSGCTVKKMKIRGVESSGMLCSERELGLSDDHSGIMSLPDEYTVGEELKVYYPDDTCFSIDIVPSRGDCLSMTGVAREVAARYRLPIKDTSRRPLETPHDRVHDAITVTIDDADACPRYTGRLVRNVTVRPSPLWMQQRLSRAGLRPINNIVDVTNYLLLHFGQPMHAFDFDRIAGRAITVRKACCELAFKTLDKIERRLVADDLLICDANGPVALAGVMGGAGSEIADTTKNVFIECAYFNPVAIRKTSRRLGLSTDSSYRFERGVDPEQGLLDALDTAAALMQELGGGSVAAGRIDAYPQPLSPKRVAIRASRTSRVLGHPIAADRIRDLLTSIGLACRNKDQDTIECTAPLYRHDLGIEEDLIEEVGRLHGYDTIPASISAKVPLVAMAHTTEQVNDLIRQTCAHLGFNEIVTNSLVSEKKRALLTPELTPVVLRNPLSPDMAQLRTTLAASMLEVLAYNRNRDSSNNKFFEIGKTFSKDASGDVNEADVLGMLVDGDWTEVSWNSPPLPTTDYYLVKGVLEKVAYSLGRLELSISPASRIPPLFDDDTVSFRMGPLVTGMAGKIPVPVLGSFGIEGTVYFVECDMTSFLRSPLPAVQCTPLPRFPALKRDFCFVMPETTLAGTISDCIRGISPLVEAVRPFDIFRGKNLGEGLKSITYAVSLRSEEKTLADKDVEELCAHIISTVEKTFNVQLRS
ncbi:MAG: phenylalanine--tRNA ligase subunit beta [Chitinispirillaceae bacterium]|nr:phenylalanine--tRNA ligase subunit beta [Chitinispirillaceae bacterium]